MPDVLWDDTQTANTSVITAAKWNAMVTWLKSTMQMAPAGVKWDPGASNSPTLTRVDENGTTVTRTRDYFDTHEVFRNIRRCNVSDAGVVTAYFGEAAYKTDGSNGQVMVQIKKFYYKAQKVGTAYTWWISPALDIGFKVHPAFVVDGVEKAYIYVGAFEASVYDVTANAIEVNTLKVTAGAVAPANLTLVADGNYSFTVALTAADSAETVVDKIVAAGVKTDFQGVTWTPTETSVDTLTYTSNKSGLKTTLARPIETKGSVGSGTAASADATTLTCSGKAWTVNGWAGYVCRILTGTGAGSVGVIASNTATVLTVADWLVGADPSTGSTFEITATGVALTITKTTSGAGGYILNDSAGVSVTATTGDKLCSIAGVKPTSGWNNSITLHNFRTLANNRGTGWGLKNFNQMSAIQLLYLIEYATLQSQTAIGAGVTAVTDATAGSLYNNAINTGYTAGVNMTSASVHLATGAVSLGNVSGECPLVEHYKTGEAAKANSYRGIENIWGNLYKWVDGLNMHDRRVWVADHDFATNFDAFSHPYVDTGITNCDTNGYPTDIGFSSTFDYAFLPSSITGTSPSSTTYLCDYYYQATGNMAAFFGGYWGSGAAAGAFLWSLDNDASLVHRAIGARLRYTAPV